MQKLSITEQIIMNFLLKFKHIEKRRVFLTYLFISLDKTVYYNNKYKKSKKLNK